MTAKTAMPITCSRVKPITKGIRAKGLTATGADASGDGQSLTS
jgi:hypothetical protein